MFNSTLIEKISLLHIPTSLFIANASKLIHLPDNLKIDSTLKLVNCPNLKTLGKNIHVGGSLYLRQCEQIQELPENLFVGENLYLSKKLYTQTLTKINSADQDKLKEYFKHIEVKGSILLDPTYI